MSTPHASSPSQKTTFLQGRVFELVVCALAFIAALIAMLQIPLTAHSDTNQVTVSMFTIFAIEGVAAALMLRHGVLKMLKDKSIENPFHRWLFFWLLPPTIFLMQLPWIFAGVYNADDVNTIGALAMLFFLPWLMIGLSFLAVGVFWAPLEMTARALYKTIITRGEEGPAQLAMGLYFLLWDAIIICGVLAASTDRVSYQAHSALLAALLGIPGDYTIKDETFLWVTRILLIIAIALPIITGRKKQDIAERPITKRDSIKDKN